MMRLSFKIKFTYLFLVAFGLMISSGVQAKDKAPPQYQKAILNAIKETQEPRTVYRQVKQPKGNTITVPETEYSKVYHIRVLMGDEMIVGRYTPALSFKKPPHWSMGQPLEVRFQKDNMYIKKPNGKELKTKIEARSQVD